MAISAIDWVIIAAFFLVSLAIGAWASRRAGSSSTEFFLSGRHMPWYLLGMSMVATTFSIDTPNLVADITRQNGVAGNWVWWAFLLTGMLTVFVYARLWRRSNVMTDIEFYELRYSGKPAAFLRGFRAIYLGVFFNIMIMAAVTLAVIKFGAVLLGLNAVETVVLAGGVTVIYSSLGGLLGVLLTDFILFVIALIGSIAAAYFAVTLPEVGGLSQLFAHPNVSSRLSMLPDFSNGELAMTIFVIPFLVQWWSVWYPGAEPGGGGYISQRMLAAKNEEHAVGAALLFNVAHYAVRPWPWLLVALASLVVYPDLDALRTAFPDIEAQYLTNDLAYPVMLRFIPTGILGLVLASLIAAYMSTISTHLNWGSSYVVNDFYKRFIRPDAPEKELVAIGRLSTILMMVIASTIAIYLETSLQAFNILLQIGAGTGLLFILRWFWWRVNAFSELTAMLVSFVVAIVMARGDLPAPQQLVIGVAITTACWLLVTWLTPPASEEKLRSFYKLVRPGGPGWRRVVARAHAADIILDKDPAHWNVPRELLAMVVACLGVYSTLFAIGNWLYGRNVPAILLTLLAAGMTFWLVRLWPRPKAGVGIDPKAS